ncbi:hypothetical protein B8V81_2246 [Paenibacillus pasadenensis]|uniref:Uncharacterized protein n=1 Tax=Paenibacillus pasadenensis TaxID=217090 RepID=A0A2N5N0G6_9BACL|nr:hypothetical protein B8V81_2246 [Paenibacillus pasadenensis]
MKWKKIAYSEIKGNNDSTNRKRATERRDDEGEEETACRDFHSEAD